MDSNRLPMLAAEIMRVHAEARRAAHMSLVHAIEAGEALAPSLISSPVNFLSGPTETLDLTTEHGCRRQ
jgi:hypothetical protein